MEEENLKFLAPTSIIDSNHRSVRDFAMETIDGSKDPLERAVKLYLAARNSILLTLTRPSISPNIFAQAMY